MANKDSWFPGSVIYQIYPRSFYDTNNDGIGDLRGIIQKLGYLAGSENSLGVDAIWLSPFYLSPMIDFGYDVADHCAIDPVFGTMDDFDELIEKAHERNIKVILDFIPNHVSDQHKWFREARMSKNSKKRNWFVWRDLREDGAPPSNWLSVFGGSAWEFDATSKQYYLHTFLKQQPDLNWDNPEVRSAMKDIMKFWLNKGVDGFRVDSVCWLSKDEECRDDPINTDFDSRTHSSYDSLDHIYSRDGPKLYAYLSELASVLDQYKDKVIVVEANPNLNKDKGYYLSFYNNVEPHVMAPFNFAVLNMPWDARSVKHYVDTFQAGLRSEYNPIYVLSNHDKSRIVTRLGVSAARTAATLLLTLPGSPFLYYGDEIGMENAAVADDNALDPITGRETYAEAGRDPERTPMQWSNGVNAGFSAVKPWLPIGEKYLQSNVLLEEDDKSSMLNLYKQLISLRRSNEAIHHGRYEPFDAPDQDIFGFQRIVDDEVILVLLNFVGESRVVDIDGDILFSTHPTATTGVLAPNEAQIIKLRGV